MAEKALYQRIPALYKKHRSLKAVHRALDLPWGQVQKAYRRAVAEGLMNDVGVGRKSHEDQKAVSIERSGYLKPKVAGAKAYILTCAQNNTLVHQPTWQSLKVLAKALGAEIYVSQFLYAHRSHWQKNLDKKAKGKQEQAELWYDPEILPYVNNDRVQIAPGLVWCGEANNSPTAERPLSGYEVYTGRQSMVMPHTKIAMESIPTLGGSGAKFNYTTGTVTNRNYIQRKAGLKAEFHHCYGALLVEVDEAGHWWATQLNADSHGTIKCYDFEVKDGVYSEKHRVEAITFGDIHKDEIDEEVEEATFGPGGMVDVLRPRFVFMHDILNFARRSHHNIRDPYKMYGMYSQGRESIESELKEIADWIRERVYREDQQIVIVDSNHDRHLMRFMKEQDGRRDPVNALFWSKLNFALMQHIDQTGKEPENILQFAMKLIDPTLEEDCNVLFLDTDTSFVICPKEGGGIECALHFDQGGNGTRGSLRQFAKMGRRSNGGHSHSAGIDGGAYQAGTKSKLQLGYNHGLSSWSHSDIITHDNGKRQIVTFYGPGKKWRA